MKHSCCRWIYRDEDHTTLDWNYSCIASVRREGNYFQTRITWQGRVHLAKAGTRAQGIRWVSLLRPTPPPYTPWMDGSL